MKRREVIGMMLVLIGIAAADSPSLLVPVALIGAGMWMLREVLGWVKD